LPTRLGPLTRSIRAIALVPLFITPLLSLPAHAAPVRLRIVDWYRKAELLTDRSTIGRRLLRRRRLDESGDAKARKDKSRFYRPPSGTYLLATRVVRGVGQPGYASYSLRDTAFMYSWGRYWPASCVKLMAAVGALRTLKQHGLNGSTWVELEDEDGRFRGPVRLLQRRAIRKSTNTDYNRLMLIAGLDRLNEHYLRARYGLPRMVLQRRYTHPTPTANLRRSPPISFRHGKRSGTLPARQSTRTYARCPQEANCVTLFELQEVVRRVMLHHELPAARRFPIGSKDIKRLHADMLAAPNKFDPGATAAFGTAPKVFNKAGRVPGDDHLDSAFIVHGKERYLLAASVPYSGPYEKGSVTKKQLEQLGQHTLSILRRLPRTPWLQQDAGLPIAVKITKVRLEGCKKRAKVTIAIESAKATHATVWLGRRRISPRRGSAFSSHAGGGSSRRATLTFAAAAGEHALVIVTRKARSQRRGRRVGYRLLELAVDRSAMTCTNATLR
jgi:hypothetical protein